MKWLKKLLHLFTWRNKLCRKCYYVESVSNFSPCYSCVMGDQFQEGYPHRDRKIYPDEDGGIRVIDINPFAFEEAAHEKSPKRKGAKRV